ncbi:hypothetical protein DFQ26_000296, partial [Actinomortierella ambigua]
MASIDFDCLARVIEHINYPRVLFSLLTVNGDVFLLVARKLYRHPARYVLDGFIKPLVVVRGLLRLSPASDSDTQALRRTFGVPLRTESDLPLMHDYLNTFQYAIVGHYLCNLQEVDIFTTEIDRYIELAPRLSSIVKIRFYGLREVHVERAKAFVLAIQQHHGISQLVECASLALPRRDGSKTVMDKLLDRDLAALTVLRHANLPDNILSGAIKFHCLDLTTSQILG